MPAPLAAPGRRPAAVPVRLQRLQPNLPPPTGPGDGPSLAMQVAQWININVPLWYGMYKQGKKASDLLQFGLNVDCGTSEQIAVDAIKLALQPEIKTVEAAITLKAQAAAGIAFAESGPADLIIVETLIPIFVDYAVSWLYGQAIKAFVKSLLGDCQKQNTSQPPQPPQPPPGRRRAAGLTVAGSAVAGGRWTATARTGSSIPAGRSSTATGTRWAGRR